MKGRIQRLHEVDCGGCAESLLSFSTEKRFAEKDFRGEGWALTRARGWICPKCANKTKAEKAQDRQWEEERR